MKAILIWSINSLKENYNHILFVRMKLLQNNWTIEEDWINHRVQVINSVPHFLKSEGFDYLKVVIDGVLSSNLIVFFFTEESSYITTLIKYASYNSKNIIVIYKSNKQLKRLDDIDMAKINFLPIKSINKFSNLIIK